MIRRGDGFQAASIAELEHATAGSLIIERRSGGSVTMGAGRSVVEERSAGRTVDDIAARLERLEEWIAQTVQLERELAGARR